MKVEEPSGTHLPSWAKKEPAILLKARELGAPTNLPEVPMDLETQRDQLWNQLNSEAKKAILAVMHCIVGR